MVQPGCLTIEELPYLDVFSATYREDPVARIRELGHGCSVARSRRGVEWLTYDGSAALLKDERFPVGFEELLTSCGFAPSDAAYRYYASNTAALEGDAHRRQRRLLAPLLGAAVVERSRATVRDIVSQRLDAIRGDEFDFAIEVAPKVPASFFCSLIGAPACDSDFVASSSDSILKAFRGDPTNRQEIATAVDDLVDYIRSQLAVRRKRPSDDLLSALLWAEGAGETTAEEIVEILFTLLTASSDNTSAALSLAVLAFVAHPDQWDKLRQAPDLVKGAALECARFSPNVWSDPRYAREAASFEGIHIPAGTWLFASVIGSNHDPAAFDGAGEFMIDRARERPPLNFGVGRHHCMGRAIALVEMEETLRILAERFRQIAVIGDPVRDGHPHGDFVRGLPVRVRRA